MTIPRINQADLQQALPVVDDKGRPSPIFLRFINGAIRSLKNGVNQLIDIQNAVDAANAAAAAANAAAATANTVATDAAFDNAIANSGVTGMTMTATDAGASVTITISAHTRVYADGTSIGVSGGSLTGRAYSTAYYIYYNDAGHAGGGVTYLSSTTPVIQVGAVHSVGAVTTPAALAPPIYGNPKFAPGEVDAA